MPNYLLEDFYKYTMTSQYSFWKGFKKMLVQVVLFGLPLLVQVLPSDILNLTLGAILNLLANYIKVNYNNA